MADGNSEKEANGDGRMNKINNTMKIGDKFIVSGMYKRRSFWQWIRNEPKKLQQFVVKHTCTSYSENEAHNG